VPPQPTQLLLKALSQAGPLGLRQAALTALAAGRNLDAEGAASVLEGDAQLARLLGRAAWGGPGQEDACRDLAGRIQELAQAQVCLACGTCCRAGGPTLYLEDLTLVGGPGLTRVDLVTLRAGERAYSARLGRGLVLERELIKPRWREGVACTHLQGSRCATYEQRPLQCRHLQCWSGRHAGQLDHMPRLGRADIYTEDATALALMAEYDAKLPAGELMEVLQAAAQGGDQAPALAAMALEHRLRLGVSARYGYPEGELDLLLGRPSWELARGFGLTLDADDQGRPCLAAFSPSLWAGSLFPLSAARERAIVAPVRPAPRRPGNYQK